MITILITLGVSILINLVMFFVAYNLRTDKLTDISYALTFVTLAFYGLINSNKSISAILLTVMICIWALRLGIYLLQRIRKIGKDNRFDDKRDNFLSFLGFWLLQGITVWVVMIPSNLFYIFNVKGISLISIIGLFVWFVGLLIEGFSDYQKFLFKNDKKNKGKWIDIGLWKYSRHPNYFGEIMLWFGVYLFTLSGLSFNQGLIALIGPIYIAVLLIFVSGIPLLEKSSDKKWGENKKYQEYKKATSILILLPKRK